MRRTIFVFIMCFVALSLFLNRANIKQWASSTTKERIPKAVTYEQVSSSEKIDKQETTKKDFIQPELTAPAKEEVGEEDVFLDEPSSSPAEDVPLVQEQELFQEPQEEKLQSFPTSFNLAVPFTSQAPHGVWDDLHEETCEEASILMVHAFYTSVPEGMIDSSLADDAIRKVVAFEESIFGYFEDTDIAQTAVVVEKQYGYTQTEIIEEPSVDDIKGHVFAGRPVIVPLAGQEIENPFFTPPGPDYHMLVIRGWTPNGFITNDPGTRRGEAYIYSYDVLMNAIHDWKVGQNIHEGARRVLVFYP